MFTNYDYNDLNLTDDNSTRFSPLDLKKEHVPNHLKVSGLKRQKHLDLLGNLKESYIKGFAFTNLQKEKDKQKSIDCVAVASDICEFTNPYFYLSQSLYFPPPWTVNSFKNIEYQKNVDLSCFNKNYDCCRASLSNKRVRHR